MSTWTNDDGLYIRYGQGEVTAVKGGAFGAMDDGGSHVIETKITLTDLATTDTIVAEGVYVPKGYTLARVELISDVAATSAGAAVLNVGFIRASDRSTAIDADGAIAAAALATINVAGETNTMTAGTTGAGALVGSVVSADYVGLVTANYATAAYTAGVVTVRLILRRV